MNCYIRYIGIIDVEDSVHSVPFFSGLNIVTGKSSTGKSAILEIFDYCMGSSEDTIPHGKITERSKLFFTVFEFASLTLVIGRAAASKRCFLREVTGPESENVLGLIENVNEFFDKRYFIYQSEFIKVLGRYFGVTLENVDVDPMHKEITGAKSSTPSVRSFPSLMLQHQNLVANKHAVFYRFDEKIKRDQAIEHFKILMGIVGEDYFDLAKEHAEAEFELRKLEARIPKQDKARRELEAKFSQHLTEYLALAGAPLFDRTAAEIWANPQAALKAVLGTSVKVDGLSDEFEKQHDELTRKKALLMSDLRSALGKLNLVKMSSERATGIGESFVTMAIPRSTDLAHTLCPVCENPSDVPEDEANKLSEAIDWLNTELRLSSFARESLGEERRKLEVEIKDLRKDIAAVQKSLQPLDYEAERLKKSEAVDDSAKKARLKLELAIEEHIESPPSDLADMLNYWKKRVEELAALMSKYDVERELEKLQKDINIKLKEFGANFDFEETYKSGSLKFDLDTFDLWHEKQPGKRVYLRSMGSGANWLYSHLTLFMALHYQFAARSSRKGKIPPILFLDQPTQVYFPAADDGEEFEAEELSAEGKRKIKVDEDLSAVSNMFTQLAKFCDDTFRDTKVMPQIIVCDHADRLTLGEGYKFSDFVRVKWRKRGFIAD